MTTTPKPDAADLLRMDYINILPQPFLVRLYGDKILWPVNDFEVQTGLMRIDVCGKLEVKSFGEVSEILDGDMKSHDPDTLPPVWSITDAGRSALADEGGEHG